MPNRHTLHENHISELKTWLENDGWTLEDTKGFYEVLRARKDGKKHPLIVYQKLDAQHLTVQGRHEGVIRAFMRNRRK